MNKLVILIGFILVATGARGAARYSVTDLGPGEAHAINDSGQVAGIAQPTTNPPTFHAFLYTAGVMTDLGYLAGGSKSGAWGINNHGQLTGYSYVAGGASYEAFLYSGGTMTSLGGYDSFGFGINDLGQVVGVSHFSGQQRAVLYSSGSTINLGTLGSDSLALSINNSGQIVGWFYLPDHSTYHAFLYSSGVMTDLGTLGGPGASGADSINDHGQIAGYASVNDTSVHAFLLSDGRMSDLGTLGGNNSYANAINNSGQVVGSANISNGCEHAFLYSGATMLDLNNLISTNSGWTLCEAQAINTSGQIAGWGTNASSPDEAFLLTPITNSPPVVGCMPPTRASCELLPLIFATVSDPDGDAMTVVLTVNGIAAQTNTTLPAGPVSFPAIVMFSSPLPLRTNIIEVVATDTAGNTASCSTIVTVVDLTPPVIKLLKAEPSVLWPPNHKMVTVQLDALVTETCSTATWRIIGVSSNEPANDRGQGKAAPDWEIIGDHAVKLLAERSGTGQDRIYTITAQATDAAGNVSWPKTVTVTVPKSQGREK